MPREPIKIALSEPVNSYGDMISELTLKAPTAREVLKSGYPWITKMDQLTRKRSDAINMSAMRALLADMAQVPDSTIDQLQVVDLYQAVEVVKFFFLFRTPKTSSTLPSAQDDGQATKTSSGT